MEDGRYVISTAPGWKYIGEKVHCPNCHWHGDVDDLLGENETDTLWCPQCESAGWVYD